MCIRDSILPANQARVIFKSHFYFESILEKYGKRNKDWRAAGERTRGRQTPKVPCSIKDYGLGTFPSEQRDTAVGAFLTQLIMIMMVLAFAATVGRSHPGAMLHTVTEMSSALDSHPRIDRSESPPWNNGARRRPNCSSRRVVGRCMGDFRGLRTVSYTHLDVYKRQATFLTWLTASWMLPIGIATEQVAVTAISGAFAALAIGLLVVNFTGPLSVRGKGLSLIHI